MSEKISVSRFAADYEAAKNESEKTKLVKNVITRHYVPIIEKIVVLQEILGTAFRDRGGLSLPNEFSLHTNFHIAVLSLYTTLAIEKTGDGDREAGLRAYDALQACGAWNELFQAIGSDYDELARVRDMYLKNVHAENELTVQIARQVSRLGALIGSALSPLADALAGQMGDLNPDDLNAFKEELLKVVK